MASAAEKSKRARTLLKRLLNRRQWEHFNKYGSFRERVTHCGTTRLIEIGMRYSGWIQFRDLDGKDPVFFRRAGIVNLQTGWVMEDVVISMLLKVRACPHVTHPEWACVAMVTPESKELIVKRRYHLPAALRKTS